MKAYKVIFKHGHFIDLETQKRVIPIEEGEYIIAAGDSFFVEEDVKLKMENSLIVQRKKHGL